MIDNGIDGDMTTIPTGIDLSTFRDANGEAIRHMLGWGDDTVIISVGRLAKEKSFDILLEAAAIVLRQHARTRLVIVGGGLEERSLKRYAGELGIADHVDFVGTLPYEEVPGYLKAADLFSFASTTETQGLVTMEAMAAGLPIAAINATGTHDIVTDGKDGLLTENNSSHWLRRSAA